MNLTTNELMQMVDKGVGFVSYIKSIINSYHSSDYNEYHQVMLHSQLNWYNLRCENKNATELDLRNARIYILKHVVGNHIDAINNQ